MLRRHLNYNRHFEGPAAESAQKLEENGHFLLKHAFDADWIRDLKEEVVRVFREYPSDARVGSQGTPREAMFRYEMFNRSALGQKALENARILETVEPLLGSDCHIIANTVWWNPPNREESPDGQQWHVDGGPHVVRPPGVPWPEAIPYPIFVISAQIYLEPVRLADGPTAILPGSHRSGALPPHESMWDTQLRYEGASAAIHTAEAGDVTFFVSDTWHRRMPQSHDTQGRQFIQAGYARREIAPRVVQSERCCAANEEARSRAKTLRQRQLLGLHEPSHYDG